MNKWVITAGTERKGDIVSVRKEELKAPKNEQRDLGGEKDWLSYSVCWLSEH